MNIAIIATYMSFHSSFNRHIIDLLNQMGHKVHVIGSEFDKNKNRHKLDDFSSYCEKSNTTLHFLDIPRSPFKFKKIFMSYTLLCQFIKEHNIGFVHSHTPVGGFLGRISSKKMSIPNIYTAHGFHFYKGSPLCNWLTYYLVEKHLSKYTDAIITINKEDFELSKKRFRTNTYYVEGVGINYHTFFKERNVIDKSIINLLSIGEVNRNKNHKVVLKALKSSKRNYLYKIAGDGHLMNYLSRKVERHTLNQSVSLLGFTDDVRSLLWESDIFVMPSIREGLPVSILEAMASGLPIIGSNVRGIRDLIDDGLGGYLFNHSDHKKLSFVLEKLASNSKLRYEMGQHNQNKVIQFSSDIVKEKMKVIYQKHIGSV
jgi:glycosyltransferase involved in cell wall biosynthesis